MATFAIAVLLGLTIGSPATGLGKYEPGRKSLSADKCSCLAGVTLCLFLQLPCMPPTHPVPLMESIWWCSRRRQATKKVHWLMAIASTDREFITS